ncbi:phosphate/phosphite/phosphonate ABC transporter substrate-binding protein [Tabrizicola sp.]|uniref:phosphate/phosphite/phosphonate ABC transporter substrate-binding protein n=1 Tax=Tabrizicola sp. TaxID=2005166 RepID=UPI002733CD90|nr:PhnD/SsuA/transferrin family substrate-binding protein [Tabrizicola sp.]MDP3194887.1 PhnD/SsuA/transferrin family substrate-binding protein [Tabrizicola sp.]
MIASLAMYDFGPAQAANDRLWALIRTGLRGRGIAAPEALIRGEHAYWDAWQSPDLLLSQTCGYPFRARLHGQVTYVGTPDYGVEGCAPGHYRSVFVARADDPRRTLVEFDAARFAYNEPLSQSGWAAPQTHAARLGIRLVPVVQTGGHRLSAKAVAEGRADIAALDAVTHALLQTVDPEAAALRVVGLTDPTPGLPYITAQGRDPQPIFDAVSEAIAALDPVHRDTLRLKGFVRLPVADYLAVPNPPAPEQIAVPM